MDNEFKFVVKATDLTGPVLKGALGGFASFGKAAAASVAAPFKLITSPRWFGFQAFKSELSGLIGEFKRFYDMGKEDIEAGVGFQKMLGVGAEAANQWAWAIKNAAGGTIELSDAMKMGTRAAAFGVSLRQLVPIMEYVRKFAKATGQDFRGLMDSVIMSLATGRTMGLRRVGLMPAGAKSGSVDAADVAALAVQKSKSLDLSGLPPSLARVNAAWSDMVSAIATAVASSKALHDIINGLAKFMEAASRYADRMGPKITAALDKAIPKIKDAFLKLGEYIIDVFANVAAEINKALGGNWPAIRRFLANPGLGLARGDKTQDRIREELGLKGPVSGDAFRDALTKWGKGDTKGLFGTVDAEGIKAKLRGIGQAIVEEMNAPTAAPRQGFAERMVGPIVSVTKRLFGSAGEFGARGFAFTERMSKAGKMIADSLKGPIDALHDAQAALKATQDKWRELRMGNLASQFQWQVNTLPEGSYQRWRLQYSRYKGLMNALRSGRLDDVGMRSTLDELAQLGGQGGELYRYGNAKVRQELFASLRTRHDEQEKLAKAEVNREREKVKAAQDAVTATKNVTAGLVELASKGLGPFKDKLDKTRDALPGAEAADALAGGGW